MKKETAYILFFIALGVLVLLTVFSSSLPDGLEWTAHKLGFGNQEKQAVPAPLADYSVSPEMPSGLNQIISALVGIAALVGAIYLLKWFTHRREPRR